VDHNGGGLEALKDPSRFSAPSLEELLEGIDVDKLDLEMAMDDAETARYKNMIDNKSWRAVRHARVHNFNMLAKFEPGADLKKVFEQPKQPDHAEEVEASKDETSNQDSGSKAEEQDNGGEAIEGKSNSNNRVSEQESHGETIAANTGDPADPSTKPEDAPPAVEDAEKMQTDSSVAAE
jgi:THO complex subunit 1